MLTFLLAVLMGLGSLALYLSSFIYPQAHRKNDLIWSGVGLFYALVLLVCGNRITGGVLLGQMASVSLIGWLGWQTFGARVGHSPSLDELRSKLGEAWQPENRTQILGQMKEQFSGVGTQVQSMLNKSDAATTSSAEESAGGIGGTIAAITGAINGLLKKPEKNTATYVRKEFRDDSAVDDEAGFEVTAIASEKAVESKTVPVDQEGASESTVPADEIVQEEIAYEASKSDSKAVPPKPPTQDLVQAAEADAAMKDVDANPPASNEATS